MKRIQLVAACFCSAGIAYSQLQPIPSPNGVQPGLPDMNAPPVAGKGTISGTVINAKTHEPVKKANVMVNGAASLSAITDAGGNFSFRSLPAGTFWVMANQADFSAGQRRGQMAINVTLADGEEKTGVEIGLQPGGAIGGRVVNEDDQPVANCSVTATQVASKQRPGSGISVGGSTDSEGVYRVHGIAPGRYSVRAQCNQSFPAPHGFMRLNDPDIPTEGYTTASYAGGGGSASSGLLVDAGAELDGIDFHVQRSRMFTVRASVTGAEAAVLTSAQMSMISKSSQQEDEVGMPARNNGRHGVYMFRNVPPGSYEVSALSLHGDRVYDAQQDVQVGATQVTDVELRMSLGPTVSGVVVSDDPNVPLEGQQLSLKPIQSNYRGFFPVAPIAKDGSFEFKSILPGHFSLNGLQGGFFKSVTLSGREVTPSDFEIASEGGLLHISLSSRFGKVHVGAESQPQPGDSISALLLPVGGGSPQINTIAGTGPVDVNFTAVPPGKYRVLLVASDNPWIVGNDPATQKLLEDQMTQVTVAEASEQRVTATIVGKEELGKLLNATE